MRIPFETIGNNKIIRGIIHMPSKFIEKITFVILCYGMNGNRIESNRMFVKAADYFKDRGIAFVRFDYTGLGISDGDFYEANIDTKVADTISVINFVRSCCVNEECRVVLMGISDGAKVINQLMINKLVDIDCVILLNPVLTMNGTTTEDSGNNTKEIHQLISLVKHPILGKQAILKAGQFFSPKHMRQCSHNQEIFDVSDKNVICFFSRIDGLSFETKKKIEKTSCEIIEIASCSHVFAENFAQDALFEKSVKWIFEKGKIRRC